MRAAGWRAAVLAIVIAAPGCAIADPATCPEALDPPAMLTCDAAVSAARQRLSNVAGVTALRFEYASCPPNARCRYPDGANGNVIATLDDGREVGVFVGVDPAGVLLAEEPRLLTPEPQPAGP